MESSLNIVYYIFINPDRDWKIIVNGQVRDLVVGKIVYKQIYIHICCIKPELIEECKKLINNYLKNVIYSESSINQYEYPGLLLLYNLCQEEPESIFFYMHSKGMMFNNNYYIRSITEQPVLRSMLYNCEKAMEQFENKSINKVGLWVSEHGFIWLNFFYIRGSYLNFAPEINSNRYYYESYIGKGDYTDCYSLVNESICCHDQPHVVELICNLKNVPLLNEINTHFSKLIKEYTFYYGTEDNLLDITETVFRENGNLIYIPSGEDNRSGLFSDPAFGKLKKIFIKKPDGVTYSYPYYTSIYLDINEHSFYTVDDIPDEFLKLKENFKKTEKELKKMQSEFILNFGNFDEEYPEQIMSMKYIKGNEKVLEIGGNIGRNSLIISKLLNNSTNLVTLECDPVSYNKLMINRNLNNLKFNVVNAALSKKELIQKGWNTIIKPDGDIPDGYKPVKTISLNDLYHTYFLFDTLVLDCEGAFYYILQDFPEILDPVKLIIVENDYFEISHKLYIDNILKQNNFYVAYTQPGGWGPCFNNFYEVWKKD